MAITGAAVRVGTADKFGISAQFVTPFGLASIGNTMYMIANTFNPVSNALYTLNTDTGVATRVGSADNFGANLTAIRGIESIGSTLYLIAGGNLYTLNTNTGVATRVGSSTHTSQGRTLAAIGGKLYMGSSGQGLYIVNTTTGAATRVDSNTINYGITGASMSIAALGDTLYGFDSGSDALYTIDTDTEVATRIGTAVQFGVSEGQPRAAASLSNTLYMAGDNAVLYSLGSIELSAPTWMTVPTITFMLNDPVRFDLSGFVSGSPTPTITILSGTLPTGLTLNGSIIQGTPTDSGQSTVTFRATNSQGMADLDITFNVPAAPAAPSAPVWTNAPRIAGTVGTPLSYNLANDVSALPAAAFSVVHPEVLLSETVEYSIFDSRYFPTARYFDDNGNPASSELRNAITDVPDGRHAGNNEGIAIDQLLRGFIMTARYATPEPRWATIDDLNLQVGDRITLAAPIGVDGTPSGFETPHTLTITAITPILGSTRYELLPNGNLNQRSRSEGLIRVNLWYRIEGTWDVIPRLGIIAEAGDHLSVSLTRSSASGLPSGLMLSTAGGITGTPQEAGTESVEILALNSHGSDTENVVFSIASNIPAPPAWQTIPTIQAFRNRPLTENLSTYLSGSPIPTVRLDTSSSLPAGLTIASDGILSGTPTDLGDTTVILVAENSNGTDTTSFRITVVEPTGETSPLWIQDVIVKGHVGEHINHDLNRQVSGSEPIRFSLPKGSIILPHEFRFRNTIPQRPERGHHGSVSELSEYDLTRPSIYPTTIFGGRAKFLVVVRYETLTDQDQFELLNLLNYMTAARHGGIIEFNIRSLRTPGETFKYRTEVIGGGLGRQVGRLIREYLIYLDEDIEDWRSLFRDPSLSLTRVSYTVSYRPFGRAHIPPIGNIGTISYTPPDGVDNSLPAGLRLTTDGKIQGITHIPLFKPPTFPAALTLIRAANAVGSSDHSVVFDVPYRPNLLRSPSWLQSLDTSIILQRNVSVDIHISNFAAGFPNPVVSMFSGTLPKGLSFDGSDILGTPTELGETTAVFRASSSEGSADVSIRFIVAENPNHVAPEWLIDDFRLDIGGDSRDYIFDRSLLIGSPVPTITVHSGQLPQGVTLGRDDNSGIYTLTHIGYNIIPDTPITFRATNDVGFDDLTITLFAATTPTATAPSWSTIEDQDLQTGVRYNINLQDFVEGIPTPTIAIVSGTLPQGMILQNGFLVGTPISTGTTTITFRATNSEGNDDVQVTFIVSSGNFAPEWSASSTSNTAQVNELLNINLNNLVNGNPAPSISILSGTLPDGLLLDRGTILGTPTSEGISTVTFRATNSEGSDDITVRLNIVASTRHYEPIWEIIPEQTGNVMADFIYNLASDVSGVPTPTITVKQDSNLPSGLMLTAAGNITGTPVMEGTFETTFVATNSEGTAEVTVTFNIGAMIVIPNSAPEWTNPGIQSIPVSSAYTYNLNSIVSGNPRPTITIQSGALPQGITLSNGQLSGSPNTQGQSTVVFRAENTEGTQDLTVTFNVFVAGTIPSWINIPAQIVQLGSSYRLDLLDWLSGTPTPDVSISSGNLPGGFSLIGTRITGIPIELGISSVVLNATNPLGSAQITLTFNIQSIVQVDPDEVPIVLPDGYRFNIGCFTVDVDNFYFALQNVNSRQPGLLAVYDRQGVRQESEEVILPALINSGDLFRYTALEIGLDQFYLLTSDRSQVGGNQQTGAGGSVHFGRVIPIDRRGNTGTPFIVEEIGSRDFPAGMYFDTNRESLGIIELASAPAQDFGQVLIYQLDGTFVSQFGRLPQSDVSDFAYANNIFYDILGRAYSGQLSRRQGDDIDRSPNNASPGGVAFSAGQVFIYDTNSNRVFVYGTATSQRDPLPGSFTQFRGLDSQTNLYNVFSISGTGEPTIIAAQVEMISRTTAQFVNAGAGATITEQTLAHTFVPRETIPNLKKGHIITRYNPELVPAQTRFEIVGFATTGYYRTQRIFTIQKDSV